MCIVQVCSLTAAVWTPTAACLYKESRDLESPGSYALYLNRNGPGGEHHPLRHPSERAVGLQAGDNLQCLTEVLAIQRGPESHSEGAIAVCPDVQLLWKHLHPRPRKHLSLPV